MLLYFFRVWRFCYFLVFPVMFKFFAGVTPLGVSMATDIDKYLSFILTLFLAFGITFEVPVAVILLNRMGVVPLETLQAARPYVIVISFILAAIFTPPDILSQILLAIPMIVLYELGVLICRMSGKRENHNENTDT